MKNFLILFVFIITSSSLFSQNQERLSVHYMNIPDKQYEDFIKNSNNQAQDIILNERKKLNAEFNKKQVRLNDSISQITFGYR